MKQLLHMPGIVTVLNTPFLDDNTVDEDGLRRHVRYALDAGVAGFLVPAMASEVSALTGGERLRLVEIAVETSAGRVPVIGGASAADQEARMQAARDLIRIGCAGILVSIPFESEAAYRRDIFELASLNPGFLMIQDWDATGEGLPIPLILQLFEDIAEFRCLKIETANAGRKYTRVLEATKGRLHVSGGWAVTQMIEGLDRGIHAFMPTGMHYAYVRIFDSYIRGDREAAVALFRRIAPVLSFSNQKLDISILFFKRLLHAQGVYTTERARVPNDPFDIYQGRVANELAELAKSIEQELSGGQH